MFQILRYIQISQGLRNIDDQFHFGTFVISLCGIPDVILRPQRGLLTIHPFRVIFRGPGPLVRQFSVVFGLF